MYGQAVCSWWACFLFSLLAEENLMISWATMPKIMDKVSGCYVNWVWRVCHMWLCVSTIRIWHTPLWGVLHFLY
jgi:hypothetical protein